MLKLLPLDCRDVSTEVFYVCVRVMDVCDLDQREPAQNCTLHWCQQVYLCGLPLERSSCFSRGVYFWLRLMWTTLMEKKSKQSDASGLQLCHGPHRWKLLSHPFPCQRGYWDCSGKNWSKPCFSVTYLSRKNSNVISGTPICHPSPAHPEEAVGPWHKHRHTDERLRRSSSLWLDFQSWSWSKDLSVCWCRGQLLQNVQSSPHSCGSFKQMP